MIGNNSNILWSKEDNQLIKFSNLDDIVMGGIQLLIVIHLITFLRLHSLTHSLTHSCS